MSDANDIANPVETKQQATMQPEILEKQDEKPETKTKGENLFDMSKMGLLNDVFIQLTIEIGRAHIKIRDLLNLSKGSIVELDKLAGEPVSVYANGKLISMGNIITANGKYCVRLTSINEKAPTGGES